MTNDEDPFESWPGNFSGLKKSPRSYPEDYDHENGNYFQRCYYCHNLFMGHKRRFICKICLTPKRMKFSFFNYFHAGGIAAGFFALSVADVLVKEYVIGRGPIVNSWGIMSPGGKASVILFVLFFAWTILALPIIHAIRRRKNVRNNNP